MPNNKLEHIAFILDGNKRWAKKNNATIKDAYKKGLDNINILIKNCLELDLAYLTLFTLSSENIKRASINNIYQIIYDEFSTFLEKIMKDKLIRIKVIGSKNNLPNKIIELINHSENETKNNKKLLLNLAFNYGFKDEIKNVLNNVLINDKLDLKFEKNIKELFYLGTIPDPDILIRTGGEKRLSNFIMYNLTYTELFFVETLWPEFEINELIKIINTYNNISRRYGL